MGDMPWQAAAEDRMQRLQGQGFNSPFEEFAFALELSRQGVKTTYPRAIYMTGHKRNVVRKAADDRRYAAWEHLLTPDGQPVVRKDHDYISIWGFWNGPDELLAIHDGEYYHAVNAKRACRNSLISEETLGELVETMKAKLARCGFEDLNLKPDHLLISFTHKEELVTDTIGKPEVRLCNFEFVRRLASAPPSRKGSSA